MESGDSKAPSLVVPSLWPRRRFSRLDAGLPSTDEFGFVQASESDITAKQLLEHRVVLVVAPPWTGKSWVAQEIEQACLREGHRFVRRTALENLGPGSAILPSWWQEWQQSQQEALWIVDSVDEDAVIGRERYKEILGEIESLSEALRERLSILFFCREAEVPEQFRERLEESGNDLQELRLLRLDRESADELVGRSFPARDFKEVCETIQTNRLTSIAALPAVLETLAQFETSGALTVAEVWRRVLWDLLRDKGAESPEIDDLFTMATQVAIVASFCRPNALDELSSVPSGQPAFDLLVPRDHKLSSERRIAARQALKTALFTQNARPTRFLQDHTREWLAAFCMQSWQLGRVKPLVTLQDGKLNATHRGLLGILWQVAENVAVKNWIVEASGGIVPPSDAAPWSLDQALLALDRVTELARQSAWGLDFWGGREQLEPFRVPGMEAELTRRLEAEIDPLGQRLLLRIAEVIGASSAGPRALDIARSLEVQEGLGVVALLFVAKIGDDATIAALQDWIDDEFLRGRESPHLPRILRAGAWILLERQLWGWDRGARALLQWPCEILDSLDAQIGELGPGATLEAARDFVGWAIGELAAGRQALRHGELRFGMRKALELALQAMVNAPDFTELDALRLVQLVDSMPGEDKAGYFLVLEAVQGSERARRAFFLAVLDHRPDEKLPRLLRADDRSWLRREIERRESPPGVLWDCLYGLSHYEGVDPETRDEERAFMAARVPGLLEALDKSAADWKENYGGSFLERARNQEPRHDLADLVEQALEAEDWTFEQRFHQVAWLCFSEVARPSDVDGKWTELPHGLKLRTVLLCQRAFEDLVPTIRTEHNSLPGNLLAEAESFASLFGTGLLDLTSSLIEKWLPSVFSVLGHEQPEVIEKAFEVDRPASETALLSWLEGTLRLDPDDGRSIPIPSQRWSAELAGKILDLADGAEVEPDTKADLYWRCSEWQRDRVLDAARSWVAQDAIPELRRHGLDLLMVHSPQEGLPWLLTLPAAEASLERTRWINSEPNEIVGRLGWAELADLYDFLWRASPPNPSDGEEGFRAMGAVEWGGQRFRSAILEAFSAAISEPDALAALDDLASRIDEVRQWRDHRLASQQAAELLLRRQDPATGEPWLEVSQVLESIHSSDRRILRSVGDLHALVAEEIRAIGVDAKQRHLAMLYRPAAKKNEARERLHEDALQAYLHCRLSDRLERRLEKRPTIDYIGREILAHQNQKIDLGLRATSVAGGALEIVIEVKWNNHREVWTALEDQLGERYLRKGHLTHGIYLVGVCGEWASANRPEGGVPPDAEEHFRSQVAKLDGLTIEPIVLDLRWDSDPPSEPPKSPASRRRKARKLPTPPPHPTAPSTAPV